MKHTVTFLTALLLGGVCSAAEIAIRTGDNPSAMETLAARELRRYLYLTSGTLPVLEGSERARLTIRLELGAELGPEAFTLSASPDGGTQRIVGGGPLGLLYGTYRFIEHQGVRFLLHTDVIPDQRHAVTTVNDRGAPLFAVRGILPFHDFSSGPDWWTRNDYLTIVSQLPKLGMNFIGFHGYPSEPLVWIGLPGEATAQGRVTVANEAGWQNTARHNWWVAGAMKTSEFAAGASELFPDEVAGPETMAGLMPMPTTAVQRCEMFNRAADLLKETFTHARRLGVKTCIGTELPMQPKLYQGRAKALKRSTDEDTLLRDLYEGTFRRIAASHPLDYYWLWTDEGWTWNGNEPKQFAEMVRNLNVAHEVLESLGKPFALATCGWVLGPQDDRAALHAVLPRDVPMSAINREVGHEPVDPAFRRLEGRSRWAIPWLENDPNLSGPQPWVGRMRADAADALRYGCDGLLGIHWRTESIATTIRALATAGWDQSWKPTGNPPEAWNLPPAERFVCEKGNWVGGVGGEIAGATDPTIYTRIRINPQHYTIRLPNGEYRLTLQFVEPSLEAAGQRVFSIEAQGRRLVEDLDLVARAGGSKRVVDLDFPGIQVVDDYLRISFRRKVENPLIAGIVATRTDGKLTVKINCGGPAYQDYLADLSVGTPGTTGGSAIIGGNRSMPTEDFYRDFATASFGTAAGASIAAILSRMDGVAMSESSTWDGPGIPRIIATPWEQERTRWTFVAELETLRPTISGAGNLARFDAWLNHYRTGRTMCELGCARGALDAAVKRIEQARNPEARLATATGALVVRERMSRLWEDMITTQIAATHTPGEIGVIAGLERTARQTARGPDKYYLTCHDQKLAEALGAPLPAALALRTTYTGAARIIVPTTRSQVSPGEAMTLTVHLLAPKGFTGGTLHWRPLGGPAFTDIPLRHVGRAVYDVQLPAATQDIEYYLEATTTAGERLVWPATAPELNQTVIIW